MKSMPSSAKVTAKMTAVLSLSLLPCLAATSARAEEGVASERQHPDISEDSMSVGARLGLYDVSPSDNVVVGYGFYGDYAVSKNLLLGGTLDYWNDTEGDVSTPHVTFSDLALGVDGKYVFTNVNVPFRPYALAGVALHRFAVTNVGDTPDEWHGITTTATKLGVDVGGGIMYKIQRRVDVGGELRWRIVTDTVADLNQLAVSGALSYAL